MTVGTVSTRILTDIANAIRYQAGVATLYVHEDRPGWADGVSDGGIA